MKTKQLTAAQETYKKQLIRRFHALLSKTPDAKQAKEEILLSYNSASTTFLSIDQLKEACDALEGKTDPKMAEMDMWRKRLIASIGGWLRAMNKVDNINIIKGIACRASGKRELNKIPLEQLRSLYNTFLNKSRDIQSVDDLTAIELDYLAISN